jgi:hypothetical protein
MFFGNLEEQPKPLFYGASGSSKGLRFFLEGGIADFNNNIKASGVYLGGTAAANKLDDYEEGTWTPVIQHNNGTGNSSYYSFR